MKNLLGFKRLILAMAGISPFIIFKSVHAHCPLCTVGAVAAAGGAAYLGVSNIVIGVFVGAFAASMGWWFANLIKKRFIPMQRAVIVLFSYLSTIIPMLSVFNKPEGFYLSLTGNYGSLLNSTYMYNPFLVGSIIGLLTLSISPLISKKLSDYRNGRIIPYQGIGITFALLLIFSFVLEIVL